MTTMIYNLPRDLIEEIISRVPLRSMKEVRLTCKTWNNLSKSEGFTKMHIGKVTTPTRDGETMMIMMMPHKLFLRSGVVDFDPSIKVNFSFTIKVLVWNPYWGHTRWINLRYSQPPNGFDRFSYALGYEDKESCRSFKFLRFLDYFYNAPETQFFWYEIYDFDSDLWTTLDVTPHWGVHCSSSGVSIKGNTYWRAKERSSHGHKDHIICFDFTRERFGPLLPLPCSAVDVTLSCVKEEKLAALFQRLVSELEIWITTKIEAEMVSWSKLFRTDTRPKIKKPHSFFVDEEKKVFMGFGRNLDPDSNCLKTFINIVGEDGYLEKLNLVDGNCKQYVISYIPSLVQIKEGSRCKKRKQSGLEKRRFDQNMLRLGGGVKGENRSRTLRVGRVLETLQDVLGTIWDFLHCDA